VYAKEIPIVDIQLAFRAGSVRDGNQFGIADLTADLLSEGTKHYNVDQLAEAFESTGAQFDVNTTSDMAVVSLRSMTDPVALTPSIALFNQVLTQSVFPEKSILRLKQQVLQSLAQRGQFPNVLALDAFYENVFAGSPYAHRSIGNVETISPLKRGDIQAFFQRYYVANNAVMTIVGSVPLREAKKISEAVLAHVALGEKAPKLPMVTKTQSKNIHINNPSSQTHILIGTVGMNRHTPDYYALLMGNAILGGSSMTSQLFKEVREKKGWAYAVDSVFLPLENNGPFFISLQSRANEAESAVALSQKVLNDFIQHGPTKAEITAAKKNMIGLLPLRMSSNAAISAELLNITFYDLPVNRLQLFKKEIKKQTVNSVRNAFQNQMKDAGWVVVTVGKNK
jgi:zinc protease